MHRRLPLAFALLLVVAAPEARADWMKDYDLGLRALKKGDWQEAEGHFRTAIRQKAEPAARQRFQGTRFEPYLPQHYAAMAAWQRGDCAAAVDYWNAPGLAAVLPDVRDPQPGQDRARGLAECNRTLVASAEPKATTAPTASAAAPATTPPASTAAAATARDSARVASTDKPAQPSAARTSPAAATPAVASSPAPARPAAISRGAAPALLASAVEQYLAGRYGDLERADPNGIGDAAARAQLLMLRAAARYLQAELDGRDGAAFDPARADVRAAKSVQASLSPDAAMFPPRFRSFWQQTR